MKFQVFTRIGDEAENCWSDGGGLCGFETYAAAVSEVISHVETCRSAVESGYLSDAPKLTDFYVRTPSGDNLEVLPRGLPVANFSRYTRFNSAGGTVLVGEPIVVTIYRCFFSDEIGWVFHGYPTSAALQDSMRKMSLDGLPKVLLSQHDLVGDVQVTVLETALGASYIEAPDGIVFKKLGNAWTDGNISVECSFEELINLSANVDRLSF